MKSNQYIIGIDPGGAQAPSKVVDNYVGKYYIYSDGRIQHILKGNFRKIQKPVNTPKRPSDRYLRIQLLANDGKKYCKKIHRLVAEHFIPNPNNYPCVNHIDGNIYNNDVNNLEWCTYSYNAKHAVTIGLHKNKRPKITRKCDGCDTIISFDPCELEYYNYKFCGKACYHKNQGWVQIIQRKGGPKYEK